MSDTTETETETGTNTDTTDEPTPSKAELHERVEQLESTVEKLMPSRRDALRMGAAGLVGAAGLSATTQPADASTGSAGVIGSSSDRPDAFLDEANVNQLTGVSTGGDRQGCRVFLSTDQSLPNNSATQIQLDSKVYDSDSNFDTSTHVWTCPQDGLYSINVQAQFDGGADGMNNVVFIGDGGGSNVSGEGARTQHSGVDAFRGQQASSINKYSQNDTIAAYAQTTSGNQSLRSGDKNDGTFMEVAFLGGL